MKTVITFILIFISLSSTIFAQTDRQLDSLALVDLYNSTNGASWTDKTNWLTSNPIDGWFGITVIGDRVTEISIYNNNLNGTIPKTIGTLSALTKLWIGGDNITGTIPEEVYNLTSLTFLQISNSPLTGTISQNVSNLINLAKLMYYGTNISGEIPIEVCSLSNLTTLTLNWNQLSGEIPTEIGNLTNLTNLSLYSNDFTGSIPYSIGSLTNLQKLWLNNNQLSGTLTFGLASLDNLTYFNVSGNQLSGGLLPIENLSNLSSIYIQNNYFDQLPDLSAITSISHIHIYNNNFTFEDIVPNSSLTDFRYNPQDSVGAVKDTVLETGQNLTLNNPWMGDNCHYRWMKISNSGDTSLVWESNWGNYLGPPAKLTDSGTYYCEITNTQAPDLTLYRRPINVEVVLSGRDQDSLALVDLYNSTNGDNWTNNTNWLSDEKIDDWNGVNVYNGRVIQIMRYSNNLSGPIPPSIGNLSELVTLNLYGNSLTGPIPVELTNLSKLDALYLFNNNLTGALPSEIGNLSKLRVLSLSNNAFGGNIPTQIGLLSNLETLTLRSCFLTGEIPTNINSLQKLEHLELHYNSLEGPISSGFGYLKQLKKMYLNNNNLSGVIPTSISGLDSLELFHLQSNNLSGSIPAGFGNLSKLSSLWISNNDFVDLPNLSGISGLNYLKIENNQFTFEDIEPNINVNGFIYAPQDSLGETIDTMVTFGNELILSVDAGGDSSKYQWIKDAADIPGATGNSYAIDAFNSTDIGVYNCRITNTIATQLTLYSRDSNVEEYIQKLSISDIQFVDNPEQNDSSLYIGQKVKVQGLVMTNPRDVYLGARWGVFITDPTSPTAPWSSMMIIQNDTLNSVTNFQNIEAGNIVSFIGIVDEYRGSTQLLLDSTFAGAVEVISKNNPLPSPKEISLNELLKLTAIESWESAFVTVNNITVSDTANNYQLLPVKDTEGNSCYLDDYFQWFRYNLAEGNYVWPAKDTEINVNGFFRQMDSNDGSTLYAINPRDISDIQVMLADFSKINDGAVVNDGGDSRGVVWADFNNDNFVDLFVLNRNGEVNFYYKNDGNDLIRQTNGNIIPRSSFSRSATAGDYDNDGDTDIFITNSNNEHNELWENNGTGNFDLYTSGEIFSLQTNSNGSSWGDFDNDGFLDLYVANSNITENLLFKNNGDGSFAKINSIIPVTEKNESQAVSLVDTDNDGDLDIFVTNNSTDQENKLYINNGGLSFYTVSEPFNFNKSAARAACWADFDNDGDFDLFVTNAGQTNTLYKNNGINQFEKITSGDIVTDVETSQGCVVEDFDNDGLIDVYVMNIGVNSYYKNTGDFNFSKINSGALITDNSSSMGGACADFDNDGFTDILVANAGGENNDFYRNSGNANSWLKIKCEGRNSNRLGIGAKVLVKTNSEWQIRQINGQTGYLSQSGLTARFGLGNASIADTVRIVWPGGAVWDTSNVAVNRLLKIKEPVFHEDGPIVMTFDAVSITSGSAHLKGGITTKNKKVVGAKFLYGTSSNYEDSTVNFLSSEIVPHSTVNTLIYQVNSLVPSTTYYYRLVAKTADQKVFRGPEKSFTTSSITGSAPIAITGDPQNISVRTAEIKGIVNPNNSTTNVSFAYGTTSTLLPSTVVNAVETPVYGNTELSSNVFITGLDEGTTYYYRIIAQNDYGQSAGNIMSFTTDSYDQNINLSHNVSFPDKQTSDYKASDFRMIGLPGNSKMPMEQLLGGVAEEDWIAFWDNGDNQDFLIKYDGTSQFWFTTGKAFWVLKKGALNVNTQTANISLNDESEAEIPIHGGWNIITNPFNVSVTWNEVKDAASNSTIANIGDLWQFHGTFGNSNILEPYKGYYVYISAVNINIPYPSDGTKKIIAPLAKKIEGSWDINIRLQSQEYVDQSTHLGVFPEAKVGFDKLDSRKPHPAGDILNIYFEHPEWTQGNDVFARDIRAEFTEIEKWDFTVNAAKGKPAELTFSGVDDIPAEYGVYLIDKSRSEFHNLREENTYRYSPVLKTEQFIVVVGKEDMLEAELAAIVPLEFKVENNFPNPFNPETTIPVQIPKESNISVEVFNILGEKVTTLFQGKIDAGRHLFSWRAGNIPSGIYFYRISSASLGKTLTGKMILLK